MTNDELREAVEVAKKLNEKISFVLRGNIKEDHTVEVFNDDWGSLQTLITLAERVIEIGESCPKEKVCPKCGSTEWEDDYGMMRVIANKVRQLFGVKEEEK